MSFLPKIEKITRDLSFSHFLLLFGYKTFSLYFPLFLVAKGFSLPEVGYTYLLIYLPLAIFSPVVGYLNHKINPAILGTLGILGYSLYSLGMILISNPFLFYFWQIILGISAALFFVSSRAILIGLEIKNYNPAFGWFYSAPFYSNAIAPAFGAFFIWKFDFLGIFIFSLILEFICAIFYLLKFKKIAKNLPDEGFSLENLKTNYQKVLNKIKEKEILFPILISFSLLLLGGFYRAFFVLFLKENLNWSQNLILIFISTFSFFFLPLSLFLIKRLEKFGSQKNIFQGGLISGFSSIFLGIFVPILNFFSLFLINLMRSAGSLICNSGRSGLISQKLKEEPEEASTLDTIFSPLAGSLGALISGFLIGIFGYQLLFIFGGFFVVLVSLILKNLLNLRK